MEKATRASKGPVLHHNLLVLHRVLHLVLLRRLSVLLGGRRGSGRGRVSAAQSQRDIRSLASNVARGLRCRDRIEQVKELLLLYVVPRSQPVVVVPPKTRRP